MLMLLVTVLAGCANTEDRQRAAMPAAAGPMLEIDPVDMPELPRWFTNTAITLEFMPDGAYNMYAGTNRYMKPIERGRWVRMTYVSVRLEPYAVGRDAAHVRATLFKDDDEAGTLMLRLPSKSDAVAPLRALAGPPKVIEDDLFGAWQGAGDALELRRDMRFIYKRKSDANGPAALAGVAGSWRAEDHYLVLRPDSPDIAPIEFAIKREGEVVTLAAPDRTMARP